MSDTLLELYTSEVEFLLHLKQALGRLNNRIHDKLALIAIEKLKPLYPGLRFDYANAGVSGIDIRAYDERGTLQLIAEVKTTLVGRSSLRGPQKRAIEKDLKRLYNIDGDLDRYLIVLSKQTKGAIERQLDPPTHYPTVKILNALESIDVEPDDEADD